MDAREVVFWVSEAERVEYERRSWGLAEAVFAHTDVGGRREIQQTLETSRRRYEGMNPDVAEMRREQERERWRRNLRDLKALCGGRR
jgi:hypothetical protein